MKKKKQAEKNRQTAARSAFVFEELEPRVLLSADLPIDVAPDYNPDGEAEEALWQDIHALQTETAALDEVSRELVFVDTDTPDYQQLVDDLLAGQDESRRIGVILLDNDRDGIEQITESLSRFGDLDAMHIISHGTDGSIDLGGSTLDASAVQTNAELIQAWGGAFSETGDLLIYGCNLAVSPEGESLVNDLATLTGADVAASEDLTGSTEQGGDWQLEYQTGEVEATVAVSTAAQSSWSGTLATFNVDTTADTPDANPGDGFAEDGSTNTSLRAAIEEANALGGGNTITLGAGDFDLSLGTITISSDVTIIGAGADLTVIDAQSLSRVLAVTGGTVSISGVTLQNGDAGAGDGGGVHVANNAVVSMSDVLLTGHDGHFGGAIWNDGTLTLDRVTLDLNNASYGGALYNRGITTITDSTISNNTATDGGGGEGGGVWTSGAGNTLDLTNVTISGNSTDGEGGGLYNGKDATLTNVTITNNQAPQGAGIHDNGNPATTTLTNTIVAGNGTPGQEDLTGNYTSGGNNLIGIDGPSTGLTDGVNGDQVGSAVSPIDPLLGALADNGGPTLSHALLTGSTAVDGGTNTGAPVTDQRGTARDDGSIDIGAFEYVYLNAAPTFIEGAFGNWSFDEGSGDSVAEGAVGISTATLGSTTGADANDPTWTSGIFGQALQFDGVNDYVEIADAPGIDISGPEFSASLWVKPDRGPGTEDMFFMKGDRQGIGNVNYYLSWKDTGKMTWAFKSDGGFEYIDIDVTLPTVDEWNHVAVVFDRPTVSIYINGTEYTGSVGTGGTSMDKDLVANDDPLWIGAGRSGGSIVTPGNYSAPFSGAIDELALFDRALTDAEVEAIRASAPPVVTASAFNIDENSTDNTVVGTVVANDLDVGDTLTYAITAGNTNGALAIDNNGVITVANSAALDFETTPIFNLTVEATDDGSPNLSDSTSVTITLNNLNDAPIVSATALSPTWTEGVGSVAVFGSTSIDAVETGDLINVIQISVTGIADGSAETLVIDGQAIELTDLNSVTTVANGYDVDVLAPGGVASVTITKSGGFTASAAETLIDGLAYDNTSNAPQGAARAVTFALIQDDGGTANGGQNTTAYNLDSTVTMVAVNDAPTDMLITDTSNGGLSLNQDGGNDAYLLAGDGAAIFSGLTATTIEIRFSSTTLPVDGGDADFVTYAAATQSSNNIWFGTWRNDAGAGHQLGLGVDGAYRYATGFDADTLFDGQEHTVSVTWDAGNYEFFVDGVSVGSGSGFKSGHTVPGGGALVVGMEQDSIGGGFQSDQVLQATVYDVRIFDDARTAPEILAGHGQTLAPTEPGMLANWVFDNLSTSGTVIDTVSGNDLSVMHASGAGFIGSVPSLTMTLREDAPDSTVVGTAATIDPDSGDTFTYALLDDASGRFDINSSTGEIFVLDGSLIDFENASSHNVTVQTTDSGGLTYDEVFTIAVTNVNDAPVLDNSPILNLDPVAEDSGPPVGAVGTLVSSLVDLAGGGGLDNVTDPDSGAVTGIAITQAATGMGTWYYSTDDGANWNLLAGVSESNALLLTADPGSRLYFEPNPGFSGPAVNPLNFRAWDQTTGTNGGFADATVNGGTSAFSAVLEYVSAPVTPGNDAPSLTMTGTQLEYSENDGPVVVDPGMTIVDIDSASLTGATVSIVSGFASAEDSLAFVDQLGITGSYNAGSGVLTLSGVASVADYQAALRSITYTNSSEIPDTANRDISFQVSDGTASGSSSRTVTVASINDDPVNAGTLQTDLVFLQDTQGKLDLSSIDLSDVDAGGGNLTLTITSDNGHLQTLGWPGVTLGGSQSQLILTGSLTDLNDFLNDVNSIDYEHATPGANGDNVDRITVQISDNGNTGAGGGGTILLGMVNIDITATNDDPVINSDGGGVTASVNTTENTTAVTTVTATDADLDALSYFISGGADASLFSIDANSGVLTFKGAPDFENPSDSGSDNVYEVIVQVNDGNGGVDTQAISVTVSNVDPVAVNDAYSVNADATLEVDWWDTDWTYRQQLTFDNLAQSENLTDFPVLLVLNSSNIDYTQTRDDGYDLRFFAADGTQLAYEIEQWNEGGDSSVWVRVPQITGNSSSDSIWMYYGNAAAEQIAGDSGVWDSNFVGVWHLNEGQNGTGGTGVYKDSSSYGNDGNDHVAATGQEGQVTDGQDFAANDWVEIDHDASLDLRDSMTISFWIKPTSDSGTFNRVVEKGLWGYNNSYYFGGGNGINDLTFYLNGQEVFDTADNVLTKDVWQHAAVSYTSNGDGTGGTATLYLNGVEIDSGVYSNGVVVGNTGRLAIGHDDPSYDFDGFIDEVQISNTDRSSDWIAAQYQATKNQFGAEFVQFNGEEPAPATGGVMTNDLPDGTPEVNVTNLNTAGTLGLVTLNSDGTFSYDPNGQFDYLAAGVTATDTFTYDVTEANGATNTATVTITITGVNEAPLVDLSGTNDAGNNFAVTFTEDGGAVAVADTDAVVSDVDSADFQGVSVSIFGTLDGASEQFTIGGYTFSYGVTEVVSRTVGGTTFEIDYNGTGFNIVREFGGSIPAADMELLISGMTYENVSQNPTAGSRTLQFVAIDDLGAASPASNSVITVSPVNDDPYIIGSLPIDVTVVEDTPGYIDLSAIDFADVDAGNNVMDVILTTSTGGKLTASSDFDVMVFGSGTGTLTLRGGVADLNNFFSSAFRFQYSHSTTHMAGDNADTITVTANDLGNTGSGGGTNVNLDTVNVDITAKNDAPARTAGTVNNLTVLEDSGFTSLGLAGVTYGTGGGSDEISQTLTCEVTTIPDANYFGKIYLADGTTQVTTGFYTLAQIQGMQFQPVADESGGPSFFSYRVQDSGGTANGGSDMLTESIQITITPQNDAPTMITAGDPLTYTENDGPVVVNAGLVVSDVDSANLTGATVSVTSGFVLAEDTLAFVDQLGITGSYDAGTGVLTLSGTASVADYQTALRSITYANSSETPDTTNRVISFQVSDGAASGGNSRTVTVTSVNDAPVLNITGTPDLTQIDEGDINNAGDSVASIIASAGGDPISDVDASPAEGIAITWVDNSIGSWEYSTDGGSSWLAIGIVSDTSAFLLTDDANNRIRFVPAENFNGIAQFSYRAWDRTDGNANETPGVDVSGNGSTTAYSIATETASVSVRPLHVIMYIATSGDVSVSNAPGLDSWSAGEVIALGDPNIKFEPGTTDGTLYRFLDLHDFNTGAVDPVIDGIHQVSKNTSIGGNGGPGMDLFVGDILFSVNSNSVRLTGSDLTEITTNKKSLYLFRPDTPGDYSAGNFSVVLDNFSTNEVEGISLVEVDTMVGDTLLQSGTFLFNPGNSRDIFLYTADGVGAGTTTGVTSTLISGDHINMNSASAKVSGLDLIEKNVNLGDASLSDGNILVTLDGNDAGVGNNNLSVTSNDVFYLDVSTTTLGATNTTTANAYLLIEGADLNFDIAHEEITALSLEIKYGSGNEDPDISFPGTSITYTENDLAVLIDTGATVNDPDSFDFSGGILSVDFSSGGTADDRLSVHNEGGAPGQVGVTGNTVAYGGLTIGTFTGGIGTSPLVINFNSNADATAVQAMLRNISYENVTDDPGMTARNVRVVLSDGDGGTSNVENKTINMIAVNDAPALATNTGITVAEGSTGSIITAVMLNEGDPDDSGSGITYTITAVPANGTLYLSGTALVNGGSFTQADIYAGLVTYDHDGSQNFSDSFTFSLADGGEDGATTLTGQVFSITVTNVNDAPVGLPTITGVAQENQELTADTTGISDEDGLGTFNYQWSRGGVAISGATGPTYMLGNADVGATITVTVSYTDGQGRNESVTSPGVGPIVNVNDVPLANADTATTAEDVALNSIDVLGNDTDVDGDTLSVTGASALNGTVTVNPDGTLNYTPNLNFNGSDTISYDISDGNGGVATGTLTITVTAVNDNPVANADTATTAEDVALNNIDVLGNDTDVDVDVLSVTGATAANGTVTVNPEGTLNYIPNLNFNGTDTISYDIADGNGGVATGTLTITVTAVNDNPVAIDDTATTAEDVALNNIDVLGNDSDVDGDALSVTGASAANGTVTVNGDGTLNYTPNLNFNGSDTISYDIADGNGGTATGTLTITVTAVNDDPIANADTATTAEDVVLNNIDVLGNDTDVDGDILSVTGASALNGAVTVNPDGTLNYIPNLNFNGTDTISYDIADGNGGVATGTLTITVTAVNDNPVAIDDTATTAEDVALNNIDVLGNDSDVDGDALSVTGATAANGTVTVNPDGTLSYTPNQDFNGTDTIGYDIADGNGGTATGTLTITVTAVNDNPVANVDSATTSEDIVLNNIDVLGNDTDVDGDILSVTGASALNGAVTVNPDGTLNYIPNLNFNGTDTISYDIADGNGGVATGTLTITVTAVNDNPVAIDDTATTAEDVALNNIDVLGNDTDVDGDILSVTGASALNGAVTVNPDGTLNYTPNLNFNGTDAISYDVSDGNGGTATGTLTITVTGVNNNPIANADTATTSEDIALNNIDVLSNDTDVDGDVLSVTGASAANGTVTVNGDGTLNYTPNLDFNGTDTISYDIADGNGGTATGTLTITVTSVNDNPVANADTATTAEDVALNSIDVLGNDTDVDGDTLSVTGASALNGTVTVNGDGTLNYTPNLNFNGTDTISYDLSDGNGGVVTGTLTITVTAVNDNPVANAETATTAEDVALSNINVLGNDTDVDGDILSVTGASALNGTVTVNGDGTLNYTPNLNFNGTDTISYDIADGNGGTATGTLTITVTSVNDTPVANADTANTAEDVALNNIDVLGNDTDMDGDILSVTGATAANGTVTVNPDGTLNYTPNADFNGSDTISYDITDGNGGVATGTLTITVTAVNDNPVANADVATTAEDVALNSIDVLGNDTDVDGDTLSVTGASALNGTVTVNGDGTLNYTPNLNFNGTDTISYDVSDGNGGTATGTLTITVTEVNNNPIANADTATTSEDIALNNIDVLSNDTDVDGDVLSVTGATAASGSVTINPDGTLNYTPNLNFNGTDTISYDIADGNGGTATGTLTITVTAVNDNPVANADTATTAEDVALNNIDVLSNDTDVDGDVLSVTGATAASGSVTINPDGTLNYTPNLNFNGTDTISYDIADGNGGTATGTLTITVTAVNDNPVANADTATTAEDVALNNIDVLSNDTDVDGDVLSVTGATAASGSVTINPDGTLNYTPNLNFNGTDTISYDIADGNGGTATGTLTITVTAVNDNPVANADTATTAEDVALNNIDVLSNDTEVDGDVLSVTGATAASGSITINPDGTLNYTPNLNFNGTDTISYDIADGNGGTATGTLTITVTAVNDNPVANADTATTAEDVALNNIDVLSNDTDVDGDVLSVTGATAASGSVTINPDGTLNYTPNLNFNGTDTISYDIADGNGGTATGTLTITVTAVNDNPVANADTATTAEDVALNNIDVLSNDTEVDGDVLSVTGATAASGSITINPDGTLNYTPNLNFNGSDTISYDIADGNGGTATGTLTITVTAVNDNPVANADTATTSEDIALNNIDVLGNDTDVDGDILSVTGASALNGAVTVNPDGTLNYTPNLNFNGTDAISYDVSDGNGGTATGTLTITVTGVNNNPIANADTATTSEDIALNNIDVLSNDTDVDGDVLSVTGASAANGTVTVNGDGTLNYTPNLDFNGTDTISYDLSDGNGGSDTGTLTITVTAVNDNPVANADTATTAEDVVLSNIDVLGNDTDVEGGALSVTGATALNGTVTVNLDGTLNYTPNLNFNGTDTISYDIADGNGGIATGTLMITVSAVNDNPVANDDTATTTEDVTLSNIDVLGNDTDVDGDTLSVTGATAANGSVTINPDGTLNYTPNLNFNGTDTVSYDLSDGAGGISNVGSLDLLVAAANDAPAGNVPGVQTTSVNTPLIFSNLDGNSISVSDPDGSGVTMEITLSTSNGTLSLSGTSGLTFNIGDGLNDANMTFTGDAVAINAALDGLLFQPDTDYQGAVVVQLVTDDLGNYGSGGVLSVVDSISIAVNETVAVSDGLTPLDEVLGYYPDDPPTDQEETPPDPSLTPIISELPDVQQKSGGSTKSGQSDSLGTGMPVYAVLGREAVKGDVSVRESTADRYDLPTRGQENDRWVATRVWNVLVDPLISIHTIATLPPGALIWDFVDQMSDQIVNDSQAGMEAKTWLIGTTASGVTFAFSAGYVSWLLRAGYLSAALLSSAPLWREFDPLPILSASEKKKCSKGKDGQDAPQTVDSNVENIFDSGAGGKSSTNEAVS